jgi:hypothetical protein
MAEIIVTTASDTDADGLTLREALAQAALDAAADTITFASGVTAITLTQGQLIAGTDVTIDGGAPGVTIDANELSRVLLVHGSGTDVVLDGITVTGGKTTGVGQSGGGIQTAAGTSLALTDSTVSDSSTVADFTDGGGIFAAGALSLTDSTVAGNRTLGDFATGGGIYAVSAVTLLRSSIDGNSTAGTQSEGGGIYGLGGLTLTDSTVSDNSTAGDVARGGGIYAQGGLTLTGSTVSGNSTSGASSSGGGINNSIGAVSLVASTISGNTTAGANSDGGGISGPGYDAAVTLTASTISGNRALGSGSDGGGVAQNGDLIVTNSIVAGNSAYGSGPDIVRSVTSTNGHNIFGSGVLGVYGTGDRLGVAAGTLFAALDPATGGGVLADNGGPTPTIALKDASTNPALAGADPADSSATDQRGEARPQPTGTNPDIGAFELDQTSTPPVGDILGTNRADVLRGTSGVDVIRGLAGKDEIRGLQGNDTLYGDAGFDELFGNGGCDRLFGGANGDRFTFLQVGEAPARGPRYDEIMDFSRSEGDKINLRLIDADAATSGVNDTFRFIGKQALTGAAQVRYEATADGDFLVSGSNDADAAAEFAFIVRTDLAVLRGSDFLL